MAVKNNGKTAPTLPESMNGADSDVFWVSWTDKLNGETITPASSAWNLPTGFTLVDDTEDGTVTDDDGTVYADANSVEITTTETSGTHYISNTIGTSGGRSITRGFYVNVSTTV